MIFQQRAKGKCYQFYLMVVIIHVSMSFLVRAYDIYRGKKDRFSRDITKSEPIETCGPEYCTCSESKRTFIYDTKSGKGNCVKNDDFRKSEGCKKFDSIEFSSIEIVSQGSLALKVFTIFFTGSCKWKRTEYSIDGKTWMQTRGNPGKISTTLVSLQIEDTKTLLSTFPGTLLKINIECTNIFTKTTDNICLLTKVEGQTNIPSLTTASPTLRTTLPPISVRTFTTMQSRSPSVTSTFTSSISSTTLLSTSKPTTEEVIKKSPNVLPDPKNNEENDLRDLLPILVAILLFLALLFVILIVLVVHFRRKS